MFPRWMVERQYVNNNRELLQVITVYAEGDNKQLVKSENKQWTHKRELLFVEEESRHEQIRHTSKNR